MKIKQLFDLCLRERSHHFLRLEQQTLEVLSLLPHFHCRRLHYAVGVFPLHPLRGECQQHRLRKYQAVGALKILPHMIGIDQQLVQHFRGQRKHVVQKNAAVRNDNSLNRRVRNVPLMPQCNILHCSKGVAAQHTCKAGDALTGNGVALVRHCRGTLLALGEILFRLKHFGLLQMANLRGELFE